MLSHRIKYLALFGFLLTFCTTSGQKSLIDSLTHKKTAFENRSDFQETSLLYIDLLNKLSRSYIYHNNDSLKFYSKKALELSKSIEYKKGIAGAKLALGEFFVFSSDFEPGFKLIDEAGALAKEVRADSIFLRSLNSSAMGYFMSGEFSEAYKLCKEGEKFSKEFNNQEMQVTFTMNLATCFSILKIYQQALPYYQKALELISKNPDKDLEAQIQSNMGYLYMHTNDFEKGKSSCQKAISIFRENKFHSWEAFAWTTLGEIAVKENKADEALDLFSISDSLLILAKDSQRQAENYLGMAEAYLLKNDIVASKNFAENGTSIAKKIKNHTGILKGSKLLFEIASRTNQPEEALEHLNLANKISDSILESESKTKFLMLETQAKFDRNKRLSEYENGRKLARQKTITLISTILLFALILIVILFRKYARNQKKANQALKELNETKDRLFSIIGHELKTPIGTLQELLSLYSSQEISEKDISKLAPTLKENVDRSSFALTNLFFWANSKMNGNIPESKKVLLKPKINAICEGFNPRIKEKNLTVKCHIDPKLSILVDPMQLEIILQNIISNAIKFSNKGGIVCFEAVETEDGGVQITVRDFGVGMKKNVITSIKENKYLKSTTGTIGEMGTGIGLQIVMDLMRNNNGKIFFESELNQGTSVVLYFDKAK